MNYFRVCIFICLTWKSVNGHILVKGYGSSKVNSKFVLACYISPFSSGATWITDNAYFPTITCTSGGFCDTVYRDNYRFFGNVSGIYVVIDPLQHKDNQMKWTCYFASARTSYTIQINSELSSSIIQEESVLNGGQIAGIAIGCFCFAILIIVIAILFCTLRQKSRRDGYHQNSRRRRDAYNYIYHI
ncbi:uncharacterized protein LOC134720985 [Mytilus trossulus]|uniref:uncharacterized protein LOC134720985 n=1 Tax=Mytilus trossulus TaxID=6551 RepID=UPI0030068EC1